MKRIIKKVTISLFSVMGFSCVLWAVLFFNPSLSYAKKTQIGQVTVFHNQDLTNGVEQVLQKVTELLKSSEIYDEKLKIQLCLNDDEIYPNLFPVSGEPLAHARFNKTIITNGGIKFDENLIEMKWRSHPELHKFDLSWLLAHEFTHNMQHNANPIYMYSRPPGTFDWKLEGYAEYIARGFKNDGRLKEKIEDYLIKSQTGKDAVIVIEKKDGTKQVHSYYKYSLIVQFLVEKDNERYKINCTQ